MSYDVRLQRVILLASTPYEGHQLYDQRLARAFRSRGVAVVYVEPAVPVGLRRRWHVDASPTVRWIASDGMEVVTPRMLPLGRRAALAVLTSLAIYLQLRVFIRRLDPRSDGLVCIGAHPALVGRLARHRRVLLLKDDYVAGAGLTGQNPRPVHRRRRALLRLHSRVAVVSPTLAETVLREGASAVVVPAGCEPVEGNTRDPSELVDVPRPRAAFIGMLSDRIDFDVLQGVIDAGLHLVLAGRRQFRFTEQEKYDHITDSGHVTELGEVSPGELGTIIGACDIGLVPYTMSPFNLASFPLKTFEYLAAGLPVVSTPLPSVLWLDDPNVHTASTRAETTEAVTAALRSRVDPDTARACRETAARNSWDHRAATFVELLGPGADQ